VRDDQNAWSQQARIPAPDPDPMYLYDSFGADVALSADGNIMAVGNLGDNSGAMGIGGDQTDDSLPVSGAVYVFVRDDQNAWSQQAYVKASNPDEGYSFGVSVALSGNGNTLAVGAPSECSSSAGIGGNQADNSYPMAGAVYLY
jgi:hypothetical protein